MPGEPQAFTLGAVALAAQLCALPCNAVPPGYESDTRAYNLAHGRAVFTEQCMRCHESGRKGAPVFGEADDWVERLEQPLDKLVEHAISGHGRMPAKGELHLSDQDVAAAVAYVVYHGRLLLAERNARPPSADVASPDSGCGPEQSSEDCAVPAAAEPAILNMLLLLIGQDRWK